MHYIPFLALGYGEKENGACTRRTRYPRKMRCPSEIGRHSPRESDTFFYLIGMVLNDQDAVEILLV